MKKLITLMLMISLGISQAQVSIQGQEVSALWREDGRCGEKYLLPTGNPGQCDPAGNGPKKGPCCSTKGFCGNTVNHCDCAGCVDYGQVAAQLTLEQTEEPASIKKKEKETIPVKVFEHILEPELGVDVPEDKNDSSSSTVNQESKIIQTHTGAIKGKLVTTDEGFTHYHFLGIPYAQAPVGNLRFKAPLPVRPWTQTLEAFEHGPLCYQELPIGREVHLSEDCLHLSIYTEDMKLSSKPVMIWIHGGRFVQGSGNVYTPEELIKQGVIVVIMNYRLGSLGFLTFGNDIVSGNMGLKDQALAIQWIKQNIQNFGGNPNKITIFGESAGGISVHAHVLSPWNYGQIQGAIAQSGTMLLYHKLKSYGIREELFARNAAILLGCSNEGEHLNELTLDCLQNTAVKKISEKLTLTLANIFDTDMSTSFEWRPVIDNYASNPFLPMDPLEAMKTGTFNQIPFMSGTVKNEGGLTIGNFKATNQTTLQIIEKWGTIGPRFVFSSSSMKEATPEESKFANISLKYYNHPKDDTALSQDQPLMDLFTDVQFISPDQKTVQLMSRHHQHVFNYHITQQIENSLLRAILKLGPDYTPTHADDLTLLFDIDFLKKDPSADESTLSNHMVQYWTNFAKYGHPTPSAGDLPFWDTVSEKEKNYMELKAAPEMRQDLQPERMLFWERMLRAAKEDNIDRKIIYTRATQFLLDNTR